MRNTLFTTALLSATALAAESGAPASCGNKVNARAVGAPAGTGDQIVTVVQVGDRSGPLLKYFPENIVAPVGSIVQFQFNPKNHTVTESSFADPCKPLTTNLTATHPGQKSGFVPVSAQDTDVKVYNVLVNDTKPIWIYCGQGTHCQQGMSMVINQNMNDPTKTLQKYQEKARQVPPPPGMTVPPPQPTPAPRNGNTAGIDPNADPNAGSMSMGMTTSMTGTPADTTPALGANNSTTSAPPKKTDATSGAALGTPAAFQSFAGAQTGRFRQAGLVGLFIAIGAMLL